AIGALAGDLAYLPERTGIEQAFQPLARVELAARFLSREFFLPAHLLGERLAPATFFEFTFPGHDRYTLLIFRRRPRLQLFAFEAALFFAPGAHTYACAAAREKARAQQGRMIGGEYSLSLPLLPHLVAQEVEWFKARLFLEMP